MLKPEGAESLQSDRHAIAFGETNFHPLVKVRVSYFNIVQVHIKITRSFSAPGPLSSEFFDQSSFYLSLKEFVLFPKY